MLEERKSELLRELEGHYSCKQVAMSVYSQKAQETMDKLYQVCVSLVRGVIGLFTGWGQSYYLYYP